MTTTLAVSNILAATALSWAVRSATSIKTRVTTMSKLNVGDVASIPVTFKVDGVLTDPSPGVSIEVQSPSQRTAGTSTTYEVGAQLEPISTGTFRALIACTESGTWTFKWTSPGPIAQGSETGVFIVEPDPFSTAGDGSGDAVSYGEVNTASNVGEGADIFKEKVLTDLQFRGISGAGGIAVAVSGDNVVVDGSGVAGETPSGSSGQILTSDGGTGFGTPITPPGGSLVGTSATQTLSAKTLSSPTIQQTGAHAVLFQGTRFAMKSVVGEIQTSSVSAATVVSYTMSDETHCEFDAIVTFARRTSVTKAGTYKLSVAYRRTSGGAPVIVGSLVAPTAQETEANTVTIDVSGNDVRVRFTAADTDGRNVSCELRVQETTAA
jgi:hypothetical protein